MLPEDIRQLRQKMGLSIRAFAQKAGVAHTTIVRWENGTNSPKGLQLERLERLAKRAEKT
jgi:DNA-binding transcriptional regulator YiaG